MTTLPTDAAIRAMYQPAPPAWAPSRLDRSVFDRVIAVHNDKGGVFKTSIVCNVAGILAATGGVRVLVVDLDPQGNCAIGLGCTDRSDRGAALMYSLLHGDEQPPLRAIPVRDGLDLVPGGAILADLTLDMHQDPSPNPYDLLIPGLSKIVDDYQLVLIDTGPGLSKMLLAALGVARWLLTPTQPDTASILGLERVTERLTEAHEDNPALAMLGCIVVDLPSNATRMLSEAHAKLSQVVGPDLVFTSPVRQAASAAEASRALGLVAHELAKRNEAIDPFAYLRRGERPPNKAQSAAGLAADYIQLTDEILARLHDAEAQPDAESDTTDQEQ